MEKYEKEIKKIRRKIQETREEYLKRIKNMNEIKSTKLEKEIQKECFDYLKIKRIFAFKINNTGIWKSKNNAYIPAQTLGLPDLVLHFRNEVIYCEIKRKGGKLSEHQKEFQAQCERDNIKYWVISDLSELIELIDLSTV